MKKGYWLFFVLIAPLLIASVLLQGISAGTEEAIVFVVMILVGLLGPYPIQVITSWLKLTDQAAVVAAYVVSLIVGLLGLFVSQQIFEIEFTWDNVLFIGQTFFAAATFAYHRLRKNQSPLLRQ